MADINRLEPDTTYYQDIYEDGTRSPLRTQMIVQTVEIKSRVFNGQQTMTKSAVMQEVAKAMGLPIIDIPLDLVTDMEEELAIPDPLTDFLENQAKLKKELDNAFGNNP
jgi:hypothetical protein